jgi:hypothetical protein
VRILEIIKISERVVSETRGSSVDEAGALGVFKSLLKGLSLYVEERWCGWRGLRMKLAIY